MKKTETALPGVWILEPRVFQDARGAFFEAFQAETLRSLGISVPFVQDNESTSHAGVLRGLHYQCRNVQAKLIRVVQGEVFDVAVDVRRGSPTFGKWVGDRLSAANRRQMFIPGGFAHGFLVLGQPATVLYKASAYYSPADERGLLWNDPAVGIAWPLDGKTPILNDRDRAMPRLADLKPDDLIG